MESGKLKIWLPTIRAGSGADVFSQRLAKALEHQGMIVVITWFSQRYELLPFLLRHVQPPPDTDIVFANSWNGFAFKRHNLPLVVTVHHSAFDSTSRKYYSLVQNLYHSLLIRPFEKLSLHSADAITAVSRFSAGSIRQHCGVLGNIEVIYNWIDADRFRPPPNKNRSPDKPFRLLFVGKLSRLKGADLLAPIMRQLGMDFELRIVGKLKHENNHDFPSNIHSLGWLSEEEIISAYQDCDALLFPSRSEGFGYAALEAMACGIPVIASNATALPEVVMDGETGILCPVDDIGAFVNACRRLASDPVICKYMGERARQRALEQFSEPVLVKHCASLIKRVIDVHSLKMTAR